MWIPRERSDEQQRERTEPDGERHHVQRVVNAIAITINATRSSTTATVSMNARSEFGKRRPTSASIPSANAVSVDIAVPQAPAGAFDPAISQEDRDRDDHPADAGRNRQQQPPAVAQIAEIELAPRLKADDEEEQRHQARVDPVAQVERDARAADSNAQRRSFQTCS